MGQLLQAFDMVKADDKIIGFVCLTAIVITMIVLNHERSGDITMLVVSGMLGALVGRVEK